MSARLQYAAETCERLMPGFVAGMMRANGFAATPGLPGVVQAVREATRCQAVYVDASMCAGDFGEPVVFGDEVLLPDTKAEVCAAMSARLGVPVAPTDTLVDIAGRVERHKSAMRRFRRAMRRHEDRARRMGHTRAANGIRSFRLPLATGHALTVERTEGAELKLRRWARHDWQEHFSGGDDCWGNGTTAFLYDRAADAVARLDAALTEIGGAA